MIYEKENYYKLSNGKTIYAYKGIIGLSGEKLDVNMYSGYDGYIDDSIDLTMEEKREIVEFMIALWTGYREYL